MKKRNIYEVCKYLKICIFTSKYMKICNIKKSHFIQDVMKRAYFKLEY